MSRRRASRVRAESLVVGHLDLVDLAVAVGVEELERRACRRGLVDRVGLTGEVAVSVPAPRLALSETVLNRVVVDQVEADASVARAGVYGDV